MAHGTTRLRVYDRIMIRVSESQLNQVVQIGHLAQECVAERDFAGIMTRELMYLLGSSSGVFIEFDPGSPQLKLLEGTSYQVDHSNMKKYLDYYQHLDPALARYKRLSDVHEAPSVSTDQVIESDSSYRECEFYQDFLSPTGVHSAMIFGINIEGQPFGLVGMHRTEPLGHYSETDHRLAQLLIPYLSIALRFRYSRRQQEKRDDVVTNLLRLRGIRGYLMLDKNFLLRDVVGEFEDADLIAPYADLQSLRGCSVYHLLSEQVRTSLVRAREGRGREVAILLDRRGNARNSHRVEVVEHADGTRHYVLIALDQSYAGISEGRARELLLSPRQTQIVKLVALGMTNAQISESLGLQVKTVENYLTSIYQKAGTTNRTELVAVLSN